MRTLHGQAVAGAEDQIPALAAPRRPRREALLELPLAMSAELLHQRRRQSELATTLLRLRRVEVVALNRPPVWPYNGVALQRVSHMQNTLVEVDVRPSQSEQLTLTETKGDCSRIQGCQP